MSGERRVLTLPELNQTYQLNPNIAYRRRWAEKVRPSYKFIDRLEIRENLNTAGSDINPTVELKHA